MHKAKSCNKGFGFVVFSFLLLGAQPLWAQSSFGQRQQERKSSRWTLQDWFETKKRISDQNSWLAVNHANKTAVDGSMGLLHTPERVGGSLDFYMKWFGLRVAHERPVTYVPGVSSPEIGGERSKVEAQIRLFGSSIQDTNIVVRAGVDYDQVLGVSGFDAQYLGWHVEPEVQIYFAKFLGVWGSWTYRLPAKPADHRHLVLRGHSWKTAAFIEMSALRFEAGFQSRVWDFRDSTSTNSHQQTTDSLFAGLRIFY